MRKNKYLITANYVAATVYLMFSFMAWDFNPANWSSEYRVGTVIVWAMCTFIACIIVGIVSGDISQNDSQP